MFLLQTNIIMKKPLLFFCYILLVTPSFSQSFTTAEEVINKYLEVTKIKENVASITDLTMTYTSETQRGVSETEFKYSFPYKYSMTVFANGMELMSSKFDGEKAIRKSSFGGGAGQEPKSGPAVLSEAYRTHPFVEMEYKNLKFIPTLITSDNPETYVIEVKDAEGKVWKDFYSVQTGFKTKTIVKNETPRGAFESIIIFENYKAFKGSAILFSSIKKQTTQMGEITSELQTIKINKGIKPKEFEIK